MSKADDENFYKALLESTKAIPWRINWETKEFEYIGPQIEPLLGWTQESWKTAQDWIDRFHAEERESTANYCIQLCEKGEDHEADYRAIRPDGSYTWVRDVVHVIREDGKTKELVGFIFDISERKQMEDELVRLNRQLEALSFQDGLTGVSNRRLFDQTLEKEWARAQRNGQPVSLAIFDIDHFKDYNDCYGHIKGDDCLIRVARELEKMAGRPADFFGRFGGEEFVMLLPETDASAAAQIAERCRARIESLDMHHAASKVNDRVTISIGVSTQIPDQGDASVKLIEQADDNLYSAKRMGRNQVVA
ncbi:sensor domain-containing diguanylate cyclase [Marinobacterium litorale]|uniref:sensor domain-containing diguanylate cyclase n=1 Tax=Marinobacterium litorale TaxID=404770 RepID=UPI00040C2E5D|nr:sensor domain-containing diguanylate cyclase [Marinobacterium litorale]